MTHPSLISMANAETHMTITISNSTVADNVGSGTVVGTLAAVNSDGVVIPCTFTTSNNPSFAISGNNLITTWSGSITPGSYPVQVTASPEVLDDSESLTITVTAPPPPPPTFAIGARVQTTANLNVRNTPSFGGTLLGTQP